MKVVFDTNVFISAFIVTASQAERAFLLARQRRFELCTSVAILTETARKLREKFDQSDEDIKDALKMISRAADVLKPSIRLNVLKDAPDNRILECAVQARADLVVTGDRHLLRLRKFQDIPILRLVDFLRMFPEKPG
jgi:putative PIN family toxin of toxin-antitoxin system